MSVKILQNEVDENNVYQIAESINVGERTDAIDMRGFGSALIQYDIADIGINIVVGIETKIDGGGWDNANVTGEWTTKTTNGTKQFRYNGSARYLRFYWISANGGNPTISNITIYGGSR